MIKRAILIYLVLACCIYLAAADGKKQGAHKQDRANKGGAAKVPANNSTHADPKGSAQNHTSPKAPENHTAHGATTEDQFIAVVPGRVDQAVIQCTTHLPPSISASDAPTPTSKQIKEATAILEDVRTARKPAGGKGRGDKEKIEKLRRKKRALKSSLCAKKKAENVLLTDKILCSQSANSTKAALAIKKRYLEGRKTLLKRQHSDMSAALVAEKRSSGTKTKMSSDGICRVEKKEPGVRRPVFTETLRKESRKKLSKLKKKSSELEESIKHGGKAAKEQSAESTDGTCEGGNVLVVRSAVPPSEVYFKNQSTVLPPIGLVAHPERNKIARKDLDKYNSKKAGPESLCRPKRQKRGKKNDSGDDTNFVSPIVRNALDALNNMNNETLDISFDQNSVSLYVPGFGPLKLTYRFVPNRKDYSYEVFVNDGEKGAVASDTRLALMISSLTDLVLLSQVNRKSGTQKALLDPKAFVVYEPEKLLLLTKPIASVLDKTKIQLIVEQGKKVFESAGDVDIGKFVKGFFKIEEATLLVENGWKVDEFDFGEDATNVPDTNTKHSIYFKKSGEDESVQICVSLTSQAPSVLDEAEFYPKSQTIIGKVKGFGNSRVSLRYPKDDILLDLMKNVAGWPYSKLVQVK